MPGIDVVLSTRRNFLKGAAAAGLVIGFAGGRWFSAAAAETQKLPFDAYLRIAPDGALTVLSAQLEMGQGPYTGLATLVADELDADWSRVRVESASGNEKLYGNPAFGGIQGTGGSTSMPSWWDRYRQAGAAARAMLIQAAAAEWAIDPGAIRIENGVMLAPGHSASIGAFAAAAASLPVPSDPKLKDPSQWRLIGSEDLRRVDMRDKSFGSLGLFTIDVRLPGMLTAVIQHPPLFGAKVARFDAADAKAVRGVVDVVQIPSGVAVVASDTWAAIQGRRALKVEWDTTAAEIRGSEALMAEYRGLSRSAKPAVARDDGDVEGALAAAAKRGDRVVEAEYEFPYLAHAPLEPMNAVAWLRDGRLEVWSGHQLPTVYQAVAAKIMGLDPSNVTLHVMMAGGSFGRRATMDADFIVESVSVLKAMQERGNTAPIRMQWTREDDMAAGHYRPMYHHRLSAALDAAGNVTAWHQRVVGQSIMAGTAFAQAAIRNGVDNTSVEGGATLPYRIPNLKVDLVTTEAGPTVLWWRSVGSTHNAYSTEVFVDELAHQAGRDPVEFRRSMLTDRPRHLGVLNLAAEKAGWDTPPPTGIFRGIAVHESFNTFVGQVVEVSLKPDGGFKVERVVCAVDCGVAINPNVIRGQMEGGIGFALGAVMKGAITLDGGRVNESNFDTYQVLTIDEMPKVEVHIVKSTERPTGVGEPGVPPAGPALANALFAATGKRIRVLPFIRNDLRTS